MRHRALLFASFLIPFFLGVPAVLAAPPGNNLFEHATVLSGFPASATGTTYGATYEPGEPMPGDFHYINSSTWYTWTAPVSADVQVVVESDGYASLLAVWTGDPVTNLVLLGADPFRSPPGFFMQAVEGMTYHFAVYDWARFGGPIAVVVTNDTFSRISGTVTGPDGAGPLPGIRVTAAALLGETFWLARSSAVTDADGNYLLRGLAPGNYRVRFDDPVAEAYLPLYYPDADDYQGGQDVSVGESMTVEGIDASLQNASFIRGQISGPGGSPLWHEVGVALYRQEGATWSGPRFTESVAGLYSFGSLRPGIYRVEFSDPHQAFYAAQFYENAPEFALATDIEVAAESVVDGIDAALQTTPAIAGRVTDPDGVTPLKDVWVTAYKWPENESASSGLTGLDGHYLIGHLEPRVYRLLFQDTSGIHLPQAYSNAPDLASGLDIEVPMDGIVQGIDASLGHARLISGRLTRADGVTPVPFVGVIAYLLTDGDWVPVRDAYTDAMGNYTIGGLPAGTYRVGFAEENLDWFAVYYPNAPTIEEATDIVLDGPGTVTGINASVMPSSRITGLLFGPDGEPIGALLVVHALRWTGSEWGIVQSDFPFSGHGYSLRGLSEGTYRVRVMSTAGNLFYTQYYNGAASISEATDIVLGAESQVTIDFHMERRPVIRGTVTGPDGVTPLPGIQVSAWRALPLGPSQVQVVWTDHEGYYGFRAFEVGAYTVGFVDESGIYRTVYYQNSPSLVGANYIGLQRNDQITVDMSMQLLDPPPPTEWIGMEHAGADQWELRFFGPVGSSFVLQDRVATTNEWSDVGEPVTGQPGTNLFLVPSSSPWRQWRIRVAP